eukprot:TRINITY_DN51637_c0_g2_i1.p1 TRINITY_DN51637_c0_g2~~TRINITY_DN51637_c0_g2_i1.p1  ORF type:complete len:184 (+),score=31.75 TRINITY_DN51637_c0_g2_i1:59-610(+)
MATSASVREATEADFPAIVELFVEHEAMCTLGREQGVEEWVRLGKAYVDHTLQTELKSWERCSAIYGTPGNKLWILEEAGRVAGCIGALFKQSADGLELVRMYVHASCRRKGYGQMLVDTLLGHARDVGASAVELTTPSVNKGAIAFYERAGFKATKTFEIHDWGTPLELTALALRLGSIASA